MMIVRLVAIAYQKAELEELSGLYEATGQGEKLQAAAEQFNQIEQTQAVVLPIASVRLPRFPSRLAVLNT